MQISNRDFHAHLESALYQNSHTPYAYLLSMVGSREAVLALHAMLIKREPLMIRRDDGQSQYLRSGFDYFLAHQRLPSGRHHALIFSKPIVDQQVLIARSEAELTERHYRAWSAHCEVPLHPSWADWLWQTAQEYNYLTQLVGHNLVGCLITFHAEMGERVRRAVQGGILTVGQSKMPSLEVQEVSNAA